MFEFKNEIEISIDNIPLPWIPKIELYYPDLPQFPIIYINTYLDEQQIIACPVSVNYEIQEDSCNATFLVLTNVSSEDKYVKKIKNEMSERIGIADKISINTIINCCNGNEKYYDILIEIWKSVEQSYGQYIPYGKYYEEVYSIVRFVAAWQPKTGRQSEMRMLYNFLSAFGEEVIMPAKWTHLEFYVIPTINDIMFMNFEKYPRFQVLDTVMKKLFDEYFTRDVEIQGLSFKAMEKAWKQNKDQFIEFVTDPLFKNNVLSEEEKFFAEGLVDAFNRHAWRAAYFISAYMNISKNYESWSKEFYIDFYEQGSKLKGYSEKVIACFLQQGFGNSNVIPIDTWIETFYQFPLGITSRSDFYSAFVDLGKLERLIWLSSQSNKTNMKSFFNLLWCQRYGTIGNSKLRGINPIACYGCTLKRKCVGAYNNKKSKILLVNNATINFHGDESQTDDPQFVCQLTDGIPRKCYSISNGVPTLIDEFSGYILTSNDKIPDNLISKNIITFEEFINICH